MHYKNTLNKISVQIKSLFFILNENQIRSQTIGRLLITLQRFNSWKICDLDSIEN